MAHISPPHALFRPIGRDDRLHARPARAARFRRVLALALRGHLPPRPRSPQGALPEARDETGSAGVLARGYVGIAANEARKLRTARRSLGQSGCGPLEIVDDHSADERAGRAVDEARLQTFWDELIRRSARILQEIANRAVVFAPGEPAKR